MEEPFFRLWVYLSSHPLGALAATLIAYALAQEIWEKSGRAPLLNPVLIAIIAVGAGLWLLQIPYSQYFEGAKFIHVLLGPATVALAIPLYKALSDIRQSARPILGALLFGAIFAGASAVGLAALAGADLQTLASIAPKSVTTPVAMGISEQLGGLPSLTAAVVVATGVVGASLGGVVLDLARVRDDRARGFAVGLCSHGVGAARAFLRSEKAGAFASLAFALNAAATALLAPLLWSLAQNVAP